MYWFFYSWFQHNVVPLHVASRHGQADSLKTLVEAGANLSAITKVSFFYTIPKLLLFQNKEKDCTSYAENIGLFEVNPTGFPLDVYDDIPWNSLFFFIDPPPWKSTFFPQVLVRTLWNSNYFYLNMVPCTVMPAKDMSVNSRVSTGP